MNYEKIKEMCSNKWLMSIATVLITFLVLFTFHQEPMFVSDELEIFVKGQAIVSGDILYTDIGSQHMPLMYYIAALFALLGARTVVHFRVCFYVLMALIWGLMYFRYSDRFGKKAMLLYPVLYLSVLPAVELSTCILSDHFQSIGTVILLFELIQLRTDKPITIGSCLMISLAIFMSFGSAFVGIFSIFAVGVTVLALEIADWIRQKRGFFAGIGHLIARYWKLVLIVAAPFAVMIGYIVYTGALSDFIGWAYTINRAIYPKYLGYGGSVIGSLFGGIQKLLVPFTSFAFDLTGIRNIVWVVLTAFGIAAVHRVKKNRILTGGLVFLMITSATREGIDHFHGIPLMGVMAALSAFCLVDVSGKIKEFTSKQPYVRIVALILCTVMFFTPILSQVGEAASLGISEYAPKEVTESSKAVDRLTEQGEKVGFSLLDYDILINSGTIPATETGGSVPWFWEYAGKDVMQELESAPPRVFLFRTDMQTWGHAMVDYAKDLVAFVQDNYISLAAFGYDYVYVRNDYFEEAVGKLEITEEQLAAYNAAMEQTPEEGEVS